MHIIVKADATLGRLGVSGIWVGVMGWPVGNEAYLG
jgi:hypothetical protein